MKSQGEVVDGGQPENGKEEDVSELAGQRRDFSKKLAGGRTGQKNRRARSSDLFHETHAEKRELRCTTKGNEGAWHEAIYHQSLE